MGGVLVTTFRSADPRRYSSLSIRITNPTAVNTPETGFSLHYQCSIGAGFCIVMVVDDWLKMPEQAGQLLELPEPAEPAERPESHTITGTAAPLDSIMAPAVSLPEGVSREAIEHMLEATHQRRMGEEL
jgi:hypothetical protein